MTTEGTPPAAAAAADWEQFCERLKEAGKILLRPEIPTGPIDLGEGLRYLARMTRLGLDLCFEHSDPDFPVFMEVWNATLKAGADNPDNFYLNATIAGDREYRLRGQRGDSPYLRFATFANRREPDGTMTQTGILRASDMVFESDGSFEIAVAPEQQPGNWLPLAADSGLLTVRQNFADRRRGSPATVTIERLEGPATPRSLTPKQANRALKRATTWVTRVTARYAYWAEWFQARPNVLHDPETTPFREEGGDSTCYLQGYWSITADEALLIETPVPECQVWNFQLNNYWMESLDYRYYQICVNKHGAKYNPDGSVTLVIAASDPGVGNFLDTAGHRCGTMLLRWTRAESHPMPKCRVVKLASLTRNSLTQQ